MAEKHKFEKYPNEYLPLTVNFSNLLDSGETINSGSYVSAYTYPANIQVSGSTIIDDSQTTYSGATLQTYLQSGSIDTTYRIQFVARTTSNKYLEDNVYVLVKRY